MVSSLITCTCDLCIQICHEFERFSTYLPDIKVAVFYGGVHIAKHKDILKNECPHIVVGTPGRILALARDKDLSLKNVRHFILDECDKMLESLGMFIVLCFEIYIVVSFLVVEGCVMKPSFFAVFCYPISRFCIFCRHAERCAGDIQNDSS